MTPPDPVPWSPADDTPIRLRHHADTATAYGNRYASVPLEDLVRALDALQAVRDAGFDVRQRPDGQWEVSRTKDTPGALMSCTALTEKTAQP